MARTKKDSGPKSIPNSPSCPLTPAIRDDALFFWRSLEDVAGAVIVVVVDEPLISDGLNRL